MQSPAWHGGAWGDGGCRGARCTRVRAWRICLYLVHTRERTKPICHAARCTRAHAVHARQRTRKPEGRAGPTPSSTSRRPEGPASPVARGCAPSRSPPSPPPPPPAAPKTRARTPARASARAGARARVGAVGLGLGRGRARATATSTAESRKRGSGGHRSQGSAGRHTHTHTHTHTHLPLQLCLRVILVRFSRWWRLRRRRPWRTVDGLGRRQEVVVRRASAAAGWLLVECQGRAHKEAKGQAKPASQPRGHASRSCGWAVSKFERGGKPRTTRRKTLSSAGLPSRQLGCPLASWTPSSSRCQCFLHPRRPLRAREAKRTRVTSCEA